MANEEIARLLEGAPEWATHHGNVGCSLARVWLNGSQYTYCDGRQGGAVFSLQAGEGFARSEIRHVTERPAPQWSGEGLPPVGADCEAYDVEDGKWQSGRLLLHGNTDHAFASGSPEGWNKLFWACRFRPIRTPEQIAADYALAEIERLYSEGGPAAVYDAGYRKQKDN